MALFSEQAASAPAKAAHAAARRVVLLVATRKGAWLYHGDAARDLGQALDPNDELLIVQALSSG